MFEEGNIIYFDPFYFKNGNTAKAKYFIVLKNKHQSTIIASLPTRKDSVPSKNLINYGCVEQPEINLNCFIIPNNLIITDCGKKFDFTTFIYGHQIDDYEIEQMKEIYPIEGTDYTIWGKMKNDIFHDLIRCLSVSKTLKNKYKREFRL